MNKLIKMGKLIRGNWKGEIFKSPAMAKFEFIGDSKAVILKI